MSNGWSGGGSPGASTTTPGRSSLGPKMATSRPVMAAPSMRAAPAHLGACRSTLTPPLNLGQQQREPRQGQGGGHEPQRRGAEDGGDGQRPAGGPQRQPEPRPPSEAGRGTGRLGGHGELQLQGL